MKNRVRELRIQKGLTQTQLANKLNVSQGTLSLWEQGKYDIDADALKELSKIFNTTVDYIIYNVSSSYKSRSEYDNIFPMKTKKVPLLGDIACGEPIWAEEQRGEFVSVSDDIDANFCLRAKGDSMTGARIYDGDIVFIRRQPTVENGEIAAVIIDNEATLKRVYFYRDKNKLVLNPENPAFDPLVYIGSELEEIRILGKAVAFESIVR